MNTQRWHSDEKRAVPSVTKSRGVSVVVAVFVGVAIWLFARFVIGIQVMRPSLDSRGGSTELGVVSIISTCLVLGVAGWSLVALLDRRVKHPRRHWIIFGVLAIACSLAAPLSGRGVSGADRVVLVAMHLLVGGAIIIGFASSLSSSDVTWRELFLRVLDQFISLPSRRPRRS